MRQTFVLLVILFATAIASADAAEIAVTVLDQHGRPASDAVISLWPAEKGRLPSESAPEAHLIDQSNEAFLPFVTVMRRGDTVVFKNSDRTRHHVYSFSTVKPFELVLNPNEASQPLKFDQSGIAAIGCNIHDKMLAYAFVTDTPWTTQTDAQGRGRVMKVPKGRYRAEVWHPRMDPDRPAPDQTVTIGANADASFHLNLLAPPPTGGHRRHY